MPKIPSPSFKPFQPPSQGVPKIPPPSIKPSQGLNEIPNLEDFKGKKSMIITNLTRPLTSQQLEEYIEGISKIKTLWLNKIKTHAYVLFHSDDQALKVKLEIENKVFPKETGKNLKVTMVKEEKISALMEKERKAEEIGKRLDLIINGNDILLKDPNPSTSESEVKDVKVVPVDELFKKTEAKPALYFTTNNFSSTMESNKRPLDERELPQPKRHE